MKILFLSSQVPHARSIGGHQIVYQRIRRLIRKGHQVGLAALERGDKQQTDDPLYNQLVQCRRVPAPPRGTSLRRLKDYALSRVPPPFWPYRSRAMSRVVGDMVEEHRYDVVLAEFCSMGQYLYHNPWLPAVRKIISTHECTSMSARTPMYLPERTLFKSAKEHLITRDLARFEFNLYRCADRVLTLSQEDRFTLLAHAPELRVSVVPAGVDLEYFSPPITRGSEESILFTGQYQDEPNRDAFEWFVARAWPRLKQQRPQLRFFVLGPNPTPAMFALARNNPGVELLGEISDIRPYLARANVFVAPLRMGSGLRVKILEAMAAGIPVVTTSTAAEGIPVQSGVNAMMADDPAIMAESIDLLLSDPVLCRRMGERARAMVVERFNWDRNIALLEDALEEVRNKK